MRIGRVHCGHRETENEVRLKAELEKRLPRQGRKKPKVQ